MNKIKEAEGGRHFFGKKYRLLVEDPDFGGENACGPTDNPRENRQVGSGTRQDEESAWIGTSLMFTQARLRAYSKYLPA